MPLTMLVPLHCTSVTSFILLILGSRSNEDTEMPCLFLTNFFTIPLDTSDNFLGSEFSFLVVDTVIVGVGWEKPSVLYAVIFWKLVGINEILEVFAL